MTEWWVAVRVRCTHGICSFGSGGTSIDAARNVELRNVFSRWLLLFVVDVGTAQFVERECGMRMRRPMRMNGSSLPWRASWASLQPMPRATADSSTVMGRRSATFR